MMSKLPPEIEKLVGDIELPADVPANARDSVREAIESSHYLQRRMSNEMADGNLDGIVIRDRKGQLGHFDDRARAVSIDVDVFKLYGNNRQQLGDALTFVIGHEVGHANTRDDRQQALDTLKTTVRNAYWTEQSQGFVDLTPAAQEYIRFAGTDETRAEIEGWNAFASRVDGEPGELDRDQMFLRGSRFTNLVKDNGSNYAFLDGAASQDGFYLNYLAPDGKARTSDAKAVSELYFSPSLQAYYATLPLELGAAYSRDFAEHTRQDPYETRINLRALGQTQHTLEAAGLDLAGKPFAITDSSDGLNWIQLKSTGKPDKVPDLDREPAPHLQLADQPGHPAFNDFERIRLAALGSGRWNEDQCRSIAGSLLREYTADPISKRLDQCVVGNPTAKGEVNVFAVYSPFGDHGPNFRTHVEGNQAAQEPVQRNLEQVEQIRQQQTQDLLRQQTQQLDNPAQRGPSLSM
jgi:hypothetical protein